MKNRIPLFSTFSMNSISSVEFHIFCGKCTFNQNLWKAGFHYNVDKLMENTFSMNSTNSMEIFPSFRFTIRTPCFKSKVLKLFFSLFSYRFVFLLLLSSVLVPSCRTQLCEELEREKVAFEASYVTSP